MNECPSNNQQGIRCILPLDHDGPHRNDSGDGPPMEWLNLGGGIWSKEFVEGCCQRFRKGEMVEFDVYFDE
jgi:hypothetical protein